MPQPLLLLPASVENQIMAGGHLSSWNDGNGFCKVKPYNADMSVTSLLLNLFSVHSLAVTETIWAGWRRLDDQGSVCASVCVL